MQSEFDELELVEEVSPCVCAFCNRAHARSETSCPETGRLLIVAGRYAIVGVRFRRDASAVLEAVDANGAPVAVKLTVPDERDGWKTTDLAERGARLCLQLTHPGLVRMLATDLDDRGGVYQVMEWCRGGTLQERIDAGGPVVAARAFELLDGLLEALDYLHSRAMPIVHRDIKPANVMFRTNDDWRPVLVDLATATTSAQSTGTTLVLSAGFSAPEQLEGLPCAQSDIYSVGWTVVSWLTQSAPTVVRERGLRSVLREIPEVAPSVRATLEGLCETATSRRFRTAADARRRLRRRGGNDAAEAGASLTLARGLGPSAFRILVGVAAGVTVIGFVPWWFPTGPKDVPVIRGGPSPRTQERVVTPREPAAAALGEAPVVDRRAELMRVEERAAAIALRACSEGSSSGCLDFDRFCALIAFVESDFSAPSPPLELACSRRGTILSERCQSGNDGACRALHEPSRLPSSLLQQACTAGSDNACAALP